MGKNREIRKKDGEPDLQVLTIESLLLDPSNPRLRTPGENTTQLDLAREIAQHYDALALGRLIAHNGFYKNQALLVYPTSNGKFIVAEGNRRLTALLGLTDETIRKELGNVNEWLKLSEVARLKLDGKIPVYVYGGPSVLKPILAADHLNRKLSWEPFQKAREIMQLVDSEGLTFEEIEEFTGIRKEDLKSMYRDFKLTKYLTKNGFSEAVITSDFSKVGEITKIKSLREFAGIQDGKSVVAGPIRFEEERLDELTEVFEWVFGDERVTPDSREIRELGKVVTNQESLTHLRMTNDLDTSMEIFKLKSENNVESVAKSLGRALDQIERMFSKVSENRKDPAIGKSIKRAKSILKVLGDL